MSQITMRVMCEKADACTQASCQVVHVSPSHKVLCARDIDAKVLLICVPSKLNLYVSRS